jgi:hypothetical protein
MQKWIGHYKEVLHPHCTASLGHRYCVLLQSKLSYLIFMPKPCTHRMHDPGSIVPHIQPKVFIDKQMSQIEYNYYINSVSKDYDDSQRNGIAKDSITPQE